VKLETGHTVKSRFIALIGNPNTGKTTLFNALTGLRQSVGNYPGVTVERKEGIVTLADGSDAILVDLPGTYGLDPRSPDQKIAIDVLLGRIEDHPDLVVCVVDAANLERNLYLVSQIIDLQLPAVVALTMTDIARQEGIDIDVPRLEEKLGVPVVPVVATKRQGLPSLRQALSGPSTVSSTPRLWKIPETIQDDIEQLSNRLEATHGVSKSIAFHEALTLLSSGSVSGNGHAEIYKDVNNRRSRLNLLNIDCGSLIAEARYEWIQSVADACVRHNERTRRSLSDRLDILFTHKVWGFVVFIGLMALMFQTIFTWAEWPMNLVAGGIHQLATTVRSIMPSGDLRDLITDGALGGAGAVLTFLPQIMLLFLFLGILEDSGYMARAAFIMDRVMGKVGLHGKSFIPLLSSFACAIPGIMATRTIENRKDRLVTILVAPLMSCSARLPVYALMIATFIPQKRVLGVLSLPGLTLVAMYFLGVIVALSMAWVFRKTLLKGEQQVFLMELPPYRIPSVRTILLHMWDRSWAFVKRAGTFILGVSIILWFLATYPRLDGATPARQLEQSFAGRAGKLIEPAIRPLGFGWKIGIGLIGSVLQREVFVSTMGTIYNIADSGDLSTNTLQEQLRRDVDPSTGLPVFTTLTAICLMVYYVLAMQCMSTIAIVRRETNGWKWPALLLTYMTVLAWVGTFAVYRIGLWIT